MQPQRTRSLHGFDARSILLFATLTVGGTQAIWAQSLDPERAQVRSAQATAPAAPARTTPPTLAQAFERADANSDGKLTVHEAERFPAVAERFAQLDKDKNGSLSPEEFAQGIQQQP